MGCQQAISDFCAMPPADQAKENWMSVIRKARSVQLVVDDFTKLQPPDGGQSSEVVKRERRK